MPVEILFIDDEEYKTVRYRQHLERRGSVVHYCERAEDAKQRMDDNPNINAIILDIMMPTPQGVSDAVTNQGQDTGLWLLVKIEEYVLSKPRPVLILTNRNVQAVEEGLKVLKLPPFLVDVRRKCETRAVDLPDRLETFLAAAREQFTEQRDRRTAI